MATGMETVRDTMRIPKAISMLIGLAFLCGSRLAAQTDWNGDFWKTKSHDIKAVYVAGFVDGRIIGVNEAADALGTTALDAKLKTLNLKITVGQIVDGLDSFYSDWRNTRIAVRDATQYVMLEAEGKDSEDLLRYLRQYYASK
jgi:hypothetical protein